MKERKKQTIERESKRRHERERIQRNRETGRTNARERPNNKENNLTTMRE